MSESLRNDGRIWVPKKKGDTPAAGPDPRGRARLLPRAQVPELRQPRARATSPRAPPRRSATRAAASGRPASASTSTSPTPSSASAKATIRERYGNLFDMYERITDEDPYKVPMRIYPAIHYTMGGLWVDYNLMSTIPGLFVLGEANFSDHGANRLGASALMQGLADGYFVIPYTIGNYFALDQAREGRRPTTRRSRRPRRGSPTGSKTLLASRASGRSTRSTASSARSCGTTAAWPATRQGLRTALEKIPALREEFWKDVRVPGRRRGAQPVAREGRPRGRLPRVRRADVPRRAGARASRAAATSARSTRPRTARRGATTRTSATSPPGSTPARATPNRPIEPLDFEDVNLQTRSYK